MKYNCNMERILSRYCKCAKLSLGEVIQIRFIDYWEKLHSRCNLAYGFPTAMEALLWRDCCIPSSFLLILCYWAMEEVWQCTIVLSSGHGLEQFCLQWNLDESEPDLVLGRWPHPFQLSGLTFQHCSQAPLGLPRKAWKHQTLKSVCK